MMSAERVEQVGGRLSAARELWTFRRVTPQSLGGNPSPQISVGHLCRTCNDAVSHVGTMGPSSLERALVAHLAPDLIGKLAYGHFSVPDLQGWAVAAAAGGKEIQPNSTPFGHVDISVQDLRAALGG